MPNKNNKKPFSIKKLLSLIVVVVAAVAFLYSLGIFAPSNTIAPITAQPSASISPMPSDTASLAPAAPPEAAPESSAQPAAIVEDGAYTSKQDVALYIHTYGCLPDNFITKAEAETLGWSSRDGNLDEVAPGKSIGGSRFGNYEELLPMAKGRTYYECDIGYVGGFRGGDRIVYSSDGLIFYTADHYKSFEQLY
ncbi:MAG: ribonuclease domain-containing protein [Clostridia bacterium]